MFSDLNGDGSVDSTEIIQENHYYPFGMNMNGEWGTGTNQYQYNGKELSTDLGLNWYHYGFRMYDPITGGRFLSVDPLASSFPSWSGYSYSFNNPIRFIDPDGAAPMDIVDEPIVDDDGNLVGYRVEAGQGPSQIAEDLNSAETQAEFGYSLKTEATYMDVVYSNPEKFSHMDIQDIADMNAEGFRELNINEGDIISLSHLTERENEVDGIVNEIEVNKGKIKGKNDVIDSLDGVYDKTKKTHDVYNDVLQPAPGDPKVGITVAREITQSRLRSKMKDVNKQKGKVQDQIDSLKGVNRKKNNKLDSMLIHENIKN